MYTVSNKKYITKYPSVIWELVYAWMKHQMNKFDNQEF